MPYIKEDRKKTLLVSKENVKTLEETLEQIGRAMFEKGELTYCVYKLGLEYLNNHKKNYQNISDCIAAMNDSAEEFRRRILNPYEDEKIKQNGDIK